MTAATENRYGERQPSEYANYGIGTSRLIYKHTLVMQAAASGDVQPLNTTTGTSGAYFLGVASNKVDQSGGAGSSQAILNVWKTGEFTFAANGTGTSAHIGRMAFAIDDQTVGTSALVGASALYVGEIMAIPTTSTYRVRIDNAVGMPGVSIGFWTFNN